MISTLERSQPRKNIRLRQSNGALGEKLEYVVHVTWFTTRFRFTVGLPDLHKLACPHRDGGSGNENEADHSKDQSVTSQGAHAVCLASPPGGLPRR
jgi:hypothetical protein